MGKRSDFKRRKNDLYDTPKEAVTPLLEWLKNEHSKPVSYIEPCVGNFKLMTALEPHKCAFYSDIEINPFVGYAFSHDACTFDFSTISFIEDYDYFITNPPWTRKILHPMIENLSNQKPTWLLFDADWMHTKQAIPYLDRLATIISIGRVKWIPNSKYTGKDNAAWHLFTRPDEYRITQFIGRYDGKSLPYRFK